MRFERNILLLALIGLSLVSCKKFVETGPPKTALTGSEVFADDGTATSAIVGIYNRMFTSGGFASGSVGSVSFLAGLSADEYSNFYALDADQFARNALVPDNSTLSYSLWKEPYQYVYTANAILEGLSRSIGVSGAAKARLEGEAKFVRAFCNFYLVNLWGAVPLPLTTDYRVNNALARSDTGTVYAQIVSDLQAATSALPEKYLAGVSDETEERVRPNTYAASALLARVHLFRKQWAAAIEQTSRVIGATALYGLTPLNSVFIKNSQEAIWQLFPTSAYINAWDGSLFIVPEGSVPYSASLSPSLLAAFEANDNRLTDWVGSVSTNGTTYRFPFKYKVSVDLNVTEYSMIMRLAEQYLIRAEARAHTGDLPAALADLNTIRARAGLDPMPSGLSADALLAAIAHERQVELFSEWGHRWLDLKRTQQADAVLSAVKGSTWQPADVWYPIPQSDIRANGRLTQNAGY